MDGPIPHECAGQRLVHGCPDSFFPPDLRFRHVASERRAGFFDHTASYLRLKSTTRNSYILAHFMILSIKASIPTLLSWKTIIQEKKFTFPTFDLNANDRTIWPFSGLFE